MWEGTANLLKAAMKKALTKMEQEKQKLQGQKQPKQDKEDKTTKEDEEYRIS